MKLAVCLAGGGVKGAAHIGVLKALEEKKIEYDYITGTSSGSIVASLNAMGYKADEIYQFFKEYCKAINKLDIKYIAKLIGGIIFDRSIVIDGLKSGEIIEKIVNEKAKEKGISKINDIKRNLLIPAVELDSGAVYMFSSMDKRGEYSDEITYINNISIGKAVRASCSYPGVFCPCSYDNKDLIDGGIRENLPWKAAKENGADKVFCINFENKKDKKCKRNIIDVVSDSLNIMSHELSNYEIQGIDYLLTLKTKNVKLLDCSKVDELYELGYREAKKYIVEKLIK